MMNADRSQTPHVVAASLWANDWHEANNAAERALQGLEPNSLTGPVELTITERIALAAARFAQAQAVALAELVHQLEELTGEVKDVGVYVNDLNDPVSSPAPWRRRLIGWRS